MVEFKLDEIQRESKQLSLHALQCDSDSWLQNWVKDGPLERVNLMANHQMLHSPPKIFFMVMNRNFSSQS